MSLRRRLEPCEVALYRASPMPTEEVETFLNAMKIFAEDESGKDRGAEDTCTTSKFSKEEAQRERVSENHIHSAERAVGTRDRRSH